MKGDFLMPQMLAESGPLIIDTLVKHYITPRKKREDEEGHDTARVDLIYDEAFSIAKTFLNISCQHPVAALQKFGIARTPAPPWVAVHRLIIPQVTLSKAADKLVAALGGEEMAYKIAGGTMWWQVRAGPGVEAEWITMKKDYRQYVNEDKAWQKARDEALKKEDGENGDTGFTPEMNKMRCMLYIHGGAFYWGSINTHRYTIWRYARKMHGRCFAVNYRKAPQYPFPCAIQDCLAAWMYLTNPPPGAEHTAVDPKNIIIAGDSAGGNLVWTLLQILRDTPGLDLPAGAVLISPWSDLTHSFPSVVQNTATDMIPPYSFIHKPSSIWPPPPPDLTQEMQSHIRDRVKGAMSKLGRGDAKDLTSGHGENCDGISLVPQASDKTTIHTSDPDADSKVKKMLKRKEQNDEKRKSMGDGGKSEEPVDHKPFMVNPATAFDALQPYTTHGKEREPSAQSTLARMSYPMTLNVFGEDVTIDTQIQLYAANAQLCHPYVSPALGYLGGLPPILVIAGNSEVLRDEIIYAAHKAADPEKYPVREDVKKLLPSLQGIEKKYGPTDVHLQVYDGVGHDLPLFSMTRPSRGCFRAIANFCRYVTPAAPGSLAQTGESGSELGATPGVSPGISPKISPSLDGGDVLGGLITESPSESRAPSLSGQGGVIAEKKLSEGPPPLVRELSEPPVISRLEALKLQEGKRPSPRINTGDTPSLSSPTESTSLKGSTSPASSVKPSPGLPRQETAPPQLQRTDSAMKRMSGFFNLGSRTETLASTGKDGAPPSKAKAGTAGWAGIYDGANPFVDHMIRERVDFDGVTRPLEPASELPACTMPFDEIGMIKEGPAMRYVEGQAKWNHKYRHTSRRIARHRKKNLHLSRTSDLGKIVKILQKHVAGHHGHKPGHGHGKDTVRMPGAYAIPESIIAQLQPTPGSSGASTPERRLSGDSSVPHAPEVPMTDDEAGADASALGDEPSSEEEAVLGPAAHQPCDGSWEWAWALGDEAPPPSAIVSRRDVPEGRRLALLADRLAPSSGTSASPLTIWVMLATAFGQQSDGTSKSSRMFREVQGVARREETLLKKEAERLKREKDREGSGGESAGERKENVFKRLGSKLGLE